MKFLKDVLLFSFIFLCIFPLAAKAAPYWILTNGGNKCLYFGQYWDKESCNESVTKKYGSLATGQCYETYTKCYLVSLGQPGITPFPELPLPIMPSQPINNSNLYYYCDITSSQCKPFAGFYSQDECQKELRARIGERAKYQTCFLSYGSCSSVCSSPKQSFFYCIPQISKCYPTRQYDASFISYALLQCQGELSRYFPGLTSGFCYEQEEMCLQGCKPQQQPPPLPKKNYYYCLKDINKCSLTEKKYENREDCNKNLDKSKIKGECYELQDAEKCARECQPKVELGFYACLKNKDSSLRCSPSQKKYDSYARCLEEIAKEFPGQEILGKCYATDKECNAACHCGNGIVEQAFKEECDPVETLDAFQKRTKGDEHDWQAEKARCKKDCTTIPVAVVPGTYDRIEDVLDEMGIKYELIPYTDLQNIDVLKKYFAVFVNCGATMDQAGFVLRKYIEDGGKVYVSDREIKLISQELSGLDYIAEYDLAGNVQTLNMQTSNAVLAYYLGMNNFSLSFTQVGWAQVTKVKNVTDLLVSGNNHIAFLFSPGKGRVVYTSFHEADQKTIAAKLMRFFIYRVLYK